MIIRLFNDGVSPLKLFATTGGELLTSETFAGDILRYTV